MYSKGKKLLQFCLDTQTLCTHWLELIYYWNKWGGSNAKLPYCTCSLASSALTADIKLSPHAGSPEILSASSLSCTN